MSKQYDFNPGLDLSSLSSANLSQIVQAIAQIYPLSNIGCIIIQSGNSSTKTGHPDVINNPRFINYLWIDTESATNPALKRYTGNRVTLEDNYDKWTSVVAAASSITYDMIAVGGVLIQEADATPKIYFNPSAINNPTSQGLKVLRLDTNGQYVEVVDLAEILTEGTIPLNALGSTSKPYAGSALQNYFLKINSGGDAINFEPFSSSSIPDASIESAKLSGDITYGKIKPVSGGGGLPLNLLNPRHDSPQGQKYQIPRVNAAAEYLEYAYPKIIQSKLITLTNIVEIDSSVRMYKGGSLNVDSFYHSTGHVIVDTSLIPRIPSSTFIVSGSIYCSKSGSSTDPAFALLGFSGIIGSFTGNTYWQTICGAPIHYVDPAVSDYSVPTNIPVFGSFLNSSGSNLNFRLAFAYTSGSPSDALFINTHSGYGSRSFIRIDEVVLDS